MKVELKRILTFILAIAMVLTSVPANTMAAPMSDEVTVASELNKADGGQEELASGEIKVYKDSFIRDFGLNAKDSVIIEDFNENIADYLESYANEIMNNYVEVSVDNKVRENLHDSLTTKWQIKNEFGYMDLSDGKKPSNAGEFRFVISIDPTLIKADDVYVDFEVKRLNLYAQASHMPRVIAGTTAADYAKTVKENIELVDEDGDTYDGYIKDVNVTVKETYPSTKTLADTDVFKMGSDYTFNAYITLNDKYIDNVDIKQLDEMATTVGDYKSVRMILTNLTGAAADAAITRPYTGDSVAAPTASELKVEVKTVEADEKDVKDVPTAGKLTYKWQDPNGVDLDEAPSECGTYLYTVEYVDSDNIYATVKNSIKVRITPITLIVRPTLEDATVFKAQTANTIARRVGFKLINSDKTEFTDISETFFGVTYNQADESQPYVPMFDVQMGITKTVEGKTTTEWTKIAPDATFPYLSGENGEGDNKFTVEYRIVFSGNKCNYTNGTPDNVMGINKYEVNAQNINYDFNVSKDVRESRENVIPITVRNSNAEIDAKALLVNGKGLDVNDIAKSIYNHNPIFADKLSYKLAKVISTEDKEEIAADTDRSITYKWYTFTPSFDKDGKIKVDAYNHPIATMDEYDGIPMNAGYYALEISYYDNNKEYFAEPVYVYFQIEKQLISVSINSVPTAYTEQDISEYVGSLYGYADYSIYKVPGNDINTPVDSLIAFDELKERKDAYYIEWGVEVGDTLDPATAKYSDATGYFQSGLLYRVKGSITLFDSDFIIDDDYCSNVYYNNYTNQYEVETTDAEGKPVKEIKDAFNTVPVEVKKVGTKQLIFKVDPSKINFRKTYDGTGFDLSQAIADGFITAREYITGDSVDVTKLDLIVQWFNYDTSEMSYDMISPADATIVEGHGDFYVYFYGNEEYAAVDGDINSEYCSAYVINPRELKISAVAEDDITAGTEIKPYPVNELSEDEDYGVTAAGNFNLNANKAFIDIDKLTVEGYIEEDSMAFGNGLVKDAAAIINPFVQINTTDRYAKYGKTYKFEILTVDYETIGEDVQYEIGEYLDFNPIFLKDVWRDNYRVVYDNNSFDVARHGHSTVVEATGEEKTSLVAKYDNETVTVKPIEGIPFLYDLKDKDNKAIPDGNYFIFNIIYPNEYKNGEISEAENVAVVNQVKETGGYVLSLVDTDKIKVAFPITATSNIYNFDVTWVPGFTEEFTVNASKAILEDDLRLAVAPAKLAFNAPVNTMAVGETQNLDVTISKVLRTDVVYLNYKVKSGTNVVSVTEDSGVVTALKKGDAVISVYPVKYVDGKFVPIAGFKAPELKLTVKDVTAPKTVTVEPKDYSIKIYYSAVPDGYRRELYILKGNKTAADFEKIIADTKNDEFPGYMDYITETIDSKDMVNTSIRNFIQPNTEYTAYVRNVAGMRQLDDGTMVVSSYAGTAKSFRTKKILMVDMVLDLTKDINANKVRVENNHYYVPYSAGKITPEFDGIFPAYPYEPAAEDGELTLFDLPLNASLTADYCQPKITYYAVEDIGDAVTTKDKTHKLLINGKFYAPSAIASIDKKGVMTLKGVGDVNIVAYDSESGLIKTFTDITITASVSSIKTKGITLKVGDATDIYDYLTFSEGKKKLAGKTGFKVNNPLTVTSSDPNVVIDLDRTAYELTHNKDDLATYGMVKAVGLAASKNVTLNVALKDNPSVSATVKVTVKPMDPVKGVKAVDTVDKFTDVIFSYKGTPYSVPTTYKVDLKDGRNKLIFSEIRELDVNGIITDCATTNVANGVYGFRTTINGLAGKSSYSVTITPVVGDVEGKAATTSFKTTDIPASYENLSSDEIDAGMEIDIRNNENDVLPYWYVASGNTYTLSAVADNYYAQVRKTDTLTWKSKDPAIAAIKVLPGTFEASMIAKKPGKTWIEITSGITKKVISRKYIEVRAVGNAGKPTYIDAEPESDIALVDAYYDRGIEVLTAANPVVIVGKTKDYKWVSFTAPHDGEFQFNKSNLQYYLKGYKPKDAEASNLIRKISGNTITLNEGQTIYLRLFGTGSTTKLTVTYKGMKAKLTETKPVATEDVASITFTVPEDGYYRFNSNIANVTVKINGSSKLLYNEGNSIAATASAYYKDAVVTITPNNNSFTSGLVISVTKVSADAAVTGALTITDVPAAGKVYYKIKADKTGAIDVNSAIVATGSELMDVYYTNGIGGYRTTLRKDTDGKNIKDEILLNEGDEIFLVVENKSSDESKTLTAVVTLKQAPIDTITIGTEKEFTVPAKSDVFAAVTLDEAEQVFKVTHDNGGYIKAYHNELASYLDMYVYSGDTFETVAEDNESDDEYKKGDVIYFRISNTSALEKKVKVTVAHDGPVVLKLAEATKVAVKDSEMKNVVFTAPEDGYYYLEAVLSKDGGITTSELAGVDIYQNNSDYSLDINYYYNWNRPSNKYENIVKLSKDDKIDCYYYIEEPAEELFDAANECTVKVTKKEFAVLPTTEITVSANSYQIYKVTVPKDEKYVVRYETESDLLPGLSTRVTNNSWYWNRKNIYSGNIYTFYEGDNYIFLENTNDEEAKIKFSELEATSTPLPATEIIVKPGETKYYTYTAKNDGLYKISYTKDVNEDTIAFVRFNDEDVDLERPDERYLTLGEKYSVEITNDKEATADAKITVKVEKIDIKPISDEAITIQKNDFAWFKFESKAATFYTIDVKNADGSKATVNAKYAYYLDEYIDTYELEYPEDMYIRNGSSIYIKLSNDSDQIVSVKLSAKPVEVLDIKLNEATPEAKLAKGAEVWYRYKIQDDWYHTVSYKASNDEAIEVSVSSINPEDGYKEITDYYSVEDDIYAYIKLKNVSEEEVTGVSVTMKVEPKYTLETGKELILTGAGSQGFYGTFTPDATGYYNIYVEPEEGVEYLRFRWSSKYLGYVYIDKDDPYADFSVDNSSIGKACSFSAFITTEDAKISKSIKVIVKKTESKAINAGKTEINAARYKENNYYTFKVPEDGRYLLNAVQADPEKEDEITPNVKCAKVDEIKDDINYGGLSYSTADAAGIPLKKDTILVIRAVNDSNVKTMKAAFELKKIEPEAFDADGKTTVKANTQKWVKYTAEKTGFYSFSLNKDDVSMDYMYEIVYIYKDLSSTENRNTSYGSFSDIFLKAGQELIFKFNNTGEEAVYSVVATPKDVHSLTVGSKVEGTTTSRYQYVYYAFTSPIGGTYVVNNDTNINSINMYAASNLSTGRYISTGSKFETKAGETYAIGVYVSRATDYSFTLENEYDKEDNLTDIYSGNNSLYYESIGDGKEYVNKVEFLNSGTYDIITKYDSWYTDINLGVAVYDKDMKLIDTATGKNEAKLTLDVNEGDVYYIRRYAPDITSTSTYSVSLNVNEVRDFN